MEMKTKFNIGETIHFMHDNRAMIGVVCGFEVSIGRTNIPNPESYCYIDHEKPSVKYYIHPPEDRKIVGDIAEWKCYSNIEELKQSVFK